MVCKITLHHFSTRNYRKPANNLWFLNFSLPIWVSSKMLKVFMLRNSLHIPLPPELAAKNLIMKFLAARKINKQERRKTNKTNLIDWYVKWEGRQISLTFCAHHPRFIIRNSSNSFQFISFPSPLPLALPCLLLLPPRATRDIGEN
jgi:hypothetical protein